MAITYSLASRSASVRSSRLSVVVRLWRTISGKLNRLLSTDITEFGR